MDKDAGIKDTGLLQMVSLTLDVQTLQRCRDEDKQEFLDFSHSIKNFVSIQNNFATIQTNFERLFAARKTPALEQTCNTPDTPPTAGGLSADSMKQTQQAIKPIGTCTLHDMHAKELQIDGTPKLPYRHPHFGHVTTIIPDHTSAPVQ
jgi:hypothetical protein